MVLAKYSGHGPWRIEMSASIENVEQMMLYEIKENMEPEPASECCIYRVYQSLRTVNEKAYTPQLISIGPLHHGIKEFANMEKRKPAYVQRFLRRIPTQQQAEILTFLIKKEQDIRNCYAETSKLTSHEFVMMILYDAVFIIELFMRSHNGDSDFFLCNPKLSTDLFLDMQLLENQLPFFVLCELYHLAFPALDFTKDPTFMDLCHEFFGNFWFKSFPNSWVGVKHFTDLCRSALLTNKPLEVKSKGKLKDLPCAVKLHESGVKFKRVKSDCLLDIRFAKRKQLGILCFEVLELQIPQIEVTDDVEFIFRNIISLEQFHYPEQSWVCSYADLMHSLIHNEKDVDFLAGEGIISNYLGDNASVATMFNNLYHQVSRGNSCYYNICEELKTHCENPWNHTKAKLTSGYFNTLKSVYFSNIWRGTATVGAVILVLLTLIQTVCSIIQLF